MSAAPAPALRALEEQTATARQQRHAAPQAMAEALEDALARVEAEGPGATAARAQRRNWELTAARARNVLGDCRRLLSAYREALDLAHAALRRFRAWEDQAGIAESLNLIGMTAWDLGDYVRGREAFQESLRLAREQGDPRAESLVLNNIGILYYELGDYAASRDHHQQALDLAREVGDAITQASALNNLGSVYSRLEQGSAAVEAYEEALALTRKLGNRQGEAYILAGLGDEAARTDEVSTAEEHYAAAQALCEDLGDRRMALEIRINRGRLRLRADRGRLRLGPQEKETSAEARAMLTAALADAEALDAKVLRFQAHAALADACEAAADTAAALRHYRAYHALEKEVFNEESNRKLRNLEVSFAVEQARKQAEIHRLRNIELAALNARISDQKEALARANDELRALNAKKNEFLGIAAHDLKNPLGAIHQLASRLQKGEADASRREDLTLIHQSAGRMQRLVADLLSVNALEREGHHLLAQRVDLVPLARETLAAHELPANEKGIALTFTRARGDLAVRGDRVALAQVWDNLVSNAIKYSPAGTVVTLFVEREDGERVVFGVRDEGPGFTAEDRARLYQPFTRLSARPTANEHSTGLGLSIVSQLVTRMEGTIDLESAPGAGACFTVRLPLPSNESAPPGG